MHEQLSRFRKERGLEHSFGDLQGNLAEEGTELLKAIYANDTHEIIDALCDHTVFIINALEAMGHDAKTHITINRTISCTPTSTASKVFIGLGNYIANRSVDTLVMMANECLATIEAMGYCAELCMLEACREVNSRDGAHDAKLGKWCKFKDAESVAKWHKADFEACKR